MFLPHYDVYRVSITEQAMAKCYLFILFNKNMKILQNMLCCATKRLECTPFNVIMIHIKQSMPLAVDNSKFAAIGLLLKWRQRASVL